MQEVNPALRLRPISNSSFAENRHSPFQGVCRDPLARPMTESFFGGKPHQALVVARQDFMDQGKNWRGQKGFARLKTYTPNYTIAAQSTAIGSYGS